MTTRNSTDSRLWWRAKRLKYNKGLVYAGILAFFTYAILSAFLIEPYEQDFDITLFTMAFQGFGYLIMMLIANVFYNLGSFVDKLLNKEDDEKFREKLFKMGYWFSFGLPFLIPVLVVIVFFVKYY